MQFLQICHEHRPDQLLHAIQPNYFHVHDALDFVKDILWDVRPNADHPFKGAAQFKSEVPEDEGVKTHQRRVVVFAEFFSFDINSLVVQFFVHRVTVLF